MDVRSELAVSNRVSLKDMTTFMNGKIVRKFYCCDSNIYNGITDKRDRPEVE